MKRSLIISEEENTKPSLQIIEGYIVYLAPITKNMNNNNHHYSFVMSLSDQTTIRITKFLTKVASCQLHKKLRESMLNGNGASLSDLKQQEENYYCTSSTKLIDKQLDFRPMCVRVQSIQSLRNNLTDGLCTVEVKICEIGDSVPYTFEQTAYKKIQKLKKIVIVGDNTGALELTIWETNFDQLEMNQSYQIKLVKCRINNNSQISLSTVAETSFIKIRDIGDVIQEIISSVNSTSICKGRIINIKQNQQEYGCQACGNHEFSRESFSLVCKTCNSRIMNDDASLNECFEIVILTDNNEEYTLSIDKTLLITFFTSINNDNKHSIESSKDENWINTLLQLHVEVKFEQSTAIVSELTLITDNINVESKNARRKNLRNNR